MSAQKNASAPQQLDQRPRTNNRLRRNNNAPNGDRPSGLTNPRRRPSTEGGRRPMNRDRSRFVSNECRSLYVNHVHAREFEGHSLTEQYKEVRFQYLRSLFETYGPIEHFEYHTDRNSAVITFATHEAAKNALDTLKNPEEKEKAVKGIENKLLHNKLPTSLAPNTRFYVDWEVRPVGRKGDSAGPKTVIAGVSSPSASRPKTVEAKPKTVAAEAKPVSPAATPEENGSAKKEKKPKKEKKAVTTDATQTPTQTQSPQPTIPHVGAEDLRREADKAKLKDELEYFRGHTSRLQQQIQAEKERCTARDVNITRLREELERIQAESARIEAKLANETEWKKTAEQRVIELQEELQHFQREQERAESRLAEFLKQ